MITYIEAILKAIEGAFLALSFEFYECKVQRVFSAIPAPPPTLFTEESA